jgi:hypothetical protein
MHNDFVDPRPKVKGKFVWLCRAILSEVCGGVASKSRATAHCGEIVA